MLGTRTVTARAPPQAPRGTLTRSIPGGGRSRDEQLNGASPLHLSLSVALVFLLQNRLGFFLSLSFVSSFFDLDGTSAG